MSKSKREAIKKANVLRNNALVTQFKKVRMKAPSITQHDSGMPPTLTGQPRPLTTTFKQLQERALATPMLDTNIDALDPNVTLDRHTKVIDYNASYLLSITLLCALHERRYYWMVQSLFVSKSSGKNLLLSLLNKKNIQSLDETVKWATDGVGYMPEMKKDKLKDAMVYWVPFTANDYHRLLEPFRALTIYADVKDEM